MNYGKLFVVATPIGNLGDITLRALETLKKVDFIACEDTRVTSKLLQRYNIQKPLISYHQHSKLQKINYIINRITDGENAALVSDAGTPGISDPGGVLIAEALRSNIKVEPIPGPSALTAILSIAGIPADKFLFLGYLPKKKGRKTILELIKIELENWPIVFFESPYRILKTLKELQDELGDVEVVVARELTKKFEEVLRGKISEIRSKIKEKGEFVVVIKSSH